MHILTYLFNLLSGVVPTMNFLVFLGFLLFDLDLLFLGKFASFSFPVAYGSRSFLMILFSTRIVKGRRTGGSG